MGGTEAKRCSVFMLGSLGSKTDTRCLRHLGFFWDLLGQNPTPVIGDLLSSLVFSWVLLGSLGSKPDTRRRRHLVLGFSPALLGFSCATQNHRNVFMQYMVDRLVKSKFG